MAQQRLLKKLAGSGSFSGLKFYKSPKEISARCSQNIIDLENDIAETRTKAEEICKRHELSFNEVFEEELTRLSDGPYANTGQEAAYMTKTTANIAPSKTNQNLLQKIQQDMAQLGTYAHQIIAYQGEIENFRRIVNHIVGERNKPIPVELTYQELTYQELEELGFN